MSDIRYEIGFSNPHRHFVDFKATFPTLGRYKIELSMSLWRPGRYESANYASKIKSISFHSRGEKLDSCKTSERSWTVDCKDLDQVEIQYTFYADHFDAGGCWLDEEQLYLNPVNCIFFDVENQDLGYHIKLDIPKDFEIACQLNHGLINELRATDFNALAEAPFICSKSLTHRTFETAGVIFHIWVQGKYEFDLDTFVGDHKLFAESQIADFGFFPSKAYHFLYQIPQIPAYHGVEHSESTVIALGPASKSGEEKFYADLIGIASHELYHTWNVKQLRPRTMVPYNYRLPQFSSLGFIYEGVTTYLGDKYLWKTGVYSDSAYAKELEIKVIRHLHNPGRTSLSLADSSVDTWVDGYEQGTPWRKVSIYNEGALVSMIIDAKIHQLSAGKKGIEDWMKVLMSAKPLASGGYDQKDLETTLYTACGWQAKEFFDLYVYGTQDMMPLVREALVQLGWNLAFEANTKLHERLYGCKLDKLKIVVATYPESQSDLAGVWLGDQVESVDEKSLVYVKKLSGLREVIHLPNGVENCYPVLKISRI
jgi:predicted metalloprotease with PDZ domain